MQLVVDTNVLLAGLLKPAVTQRLLLSPSLSLFAPEYCLEEIQKYRAEIAKRMQKKTEEIQPALNILLSKIQILPQQEYEPLKERALNSLSDPNDWPFLALALKLNCAIWSNDKAFKKQKLCKAYTTHELLRHIQKSQ
jgi:predicted nucleic acid-binding protein